MKDIKKWKWKRIQSQDNVLGALVHSQRFSLLQHCTNKKQQQEENYHFFIIVLCNTNSKNNNNKIASPLWSSRLERIICTFCFGLKVNYIFQQLGYPSNLPFRCLDCCGKMDEKGQLHNWDKKTTQPLTFLSFSCFWDQLEQYMMQGILMKWSLKTKILDCFLMFIWPFPKTSCQISS